MWQVLYLVALLDDICFVALRIVNGVAYATDINHESCFAWQEQYGHVRNPRLAVIEQSAAELLSASALR